MARAKEPIEFAIPLNQQSFEASVLIEYISKKFKLEIKETATKTGFLLDCPKCQTEKKLFYSYGGKMFICLDYKNCKWKCWNIKGLKTQIKKTKEYYVIEK